MPGHFIHSPGVCFRLSGLLVVLALLLVQPAVSTRAAGLVEEGREGYPFLQQATPQPANLPNGPSVVIITHMSARPGAAPSLLLAGFLLLALLFGLGWVTRRRYPGGRS